MSRISIIGALTLAGVVYTVGCGEPGDQIETRSSAVGGSGCLIDAAGWQVPFWTYGMRGFTDANGVHLGVFHTFGSSTITEATLTPFSSAADLGGNLMAGSTPWGYRRHDGVSAVLYLDPNGHIHERTSADVDITALYASWTVAAGPEDSNAEVPDVIGYIRSDGKSAIVVRGSNNDVWEIRSNFGSQPPWLATDLTAVSRAPYKVSWGSAFPYVRSDGANTIVYIATDNHIHELASWGNGAWGDADLSAAAGDTRAMPTSPPWGYQRSDRYNTVVFIGSDERVHELAYFPGGRWSTANLPSVPVVTPRSTYRPSGYVRNDGVNAIVYVGRTDFYQDVVHELELRPGGWTDVTLTSPSTCAQQIVQPFGHLAAGNRNSITFQTLSYQLGVVSRNELSQPLGGQWQTTAF